MLRNLVRYALYFFLVGCFGLVFGFFLAVIFRVF